MHNLLSLFTFAPVAVTLENGKTVHVRRLAAADKVEWLDSILDPSEGGPKPTATSALDRDARLLAKALCNADGVPLVTDHEQLKQIDQVVFESLVNEVMRVNGWGGDGEGDVGKKPGDTPPSPAS